MKPYTDILKIFENSSLDFKLRQNNIDEWDENFSALEYKPVDYLAAKIDYQTEYQKQNFDEFIDISSKSIDVDLTSTSSFTSPFQEVIELK